MPNIQGFLPHKEKLYHKKTKNENTHRGYPYWHITIHPIHDYTSEGTNSIVNPMKRGREGGPWGRRLYRRIGEWGCSDCMVSYTDRLTACKYILFLCLGTWIDAPVTSPFFLKNDCQFGRNPVGFRTPWRIIPLLQPPRGTTRALRIFRRLNCLGHPPYRNSILQELGGL